MIAPAAALAGCFGGAGDVTGFEVAGIVNGGAAMSGSLLALWTLPTADGEQFYKLGDGTTYATRFDIILDDPPDAALRDGVGVALLVQLPPISTVPDGIVANPNALRATGSSADHAIVYVRGAPAEPAWVTAFGPRFSCARCVRSASGLARFELAPCIEVAIQQPAAEPCDWY